MDYAPGSRAEQIMLLLLTELRAALELLVGVPFPSDARLAARCRRFLAAPTPHDTIDDWCGTLAMSRRAFTRLFRAQTGLSFAAWCRRACLVAAVPRLAAVTTIALDLGYASPAAFTNMFKQALRVPPNRYRRPAGAS